MNFNPWKRIKELELALVDMQVRLDVAYDQLEYAEERAWNRAARHWQFQLERSREAEKAAMAAMYQSSAFHDATLSFVGNADLTGFVTSKKEETK